MIYLPEDHRSTRNVHTKSRGACRPSVVIHDREVMCESGKERDAALIMASDREVIDLREQPPAVTWLDAEGTPRRHTFDFLATLRSGKKIAIAVKPMAVVKRTRFLETLGLIARHVPRSFADGVKLVTDENLPLDDVHNAVLLKHMRRTSNTEHDQLIKSLLAEHRRASIAQIVEASGLEGHAFQAIIRLVGSGAVSVVDNTRISYDAMIELAATSHTNEEVA
ncbi:TnsA endonuclease N-terminal domain-containing protein [Bosea sp. BIWAKO-01]|uniref:TnsA endonuclease N-terminal domain-containing protein n=1 Tax=Bosea sp. BIWAKO-01 TaxID=506668 RepID=UPI000AFFE287|nr:TnsA endonuclease N-terminal domain-containing protein [Bosea sp. BIWAKO-01]